jgi:rod shape-determining protein MreB and related proteins
MIFNLLGFLSKDLGIDLGTSNTLVYARGEGIVCNEPSVVAVKRGTNEVLMDGDAVGNSAKAMIGRCHAGIQAIRPMREGVIADYEITKAMLRYFIRKAHPNTRFTRPRPRLIIAVPYGITAVEKTAVVDSAMRAGARGVWLVEEPKAAAIGAGLPVTKPSGCMIVDIGAGTCEIAILSLGDVVYAESHQVAGDKFDQAVGDHMKRAYNLLIGETTAEQIKIQLGSCRPPVNGEESEMEVRGRDLINGLPRSVVIGSAEVREAIMEPVSTIISAIKSVLEKAPPEVSADLYGSGVTVAGGGALLRGIDEVIAKEVGLEVHLADDPLSCVARGTGLILEQDLWEVIQDGREVA